MQLRACHVPDEVEAVGDAQPAVMGQRFAIMDVDADRIENQGHHRGERATDRQQRGMPLRGRAVTEREHVGAIGARSPASRARTARTPSRAVDVIYSRSACSAASEFLGWSVGTSRGPECTTGVTGTPNRAYTWASSTPVGPPPSTSRLRGSTRAPVASLLVQVRIVLDARERRHLGRGADALEHDVGVVVLWVVSGHAGHGYDPQRGLNRSTRASPR